MAAYEVTIVRTERITFTLDAEDRYDAEERYLTDGEETVAETVAVTVESARPAPA